MYHFRGAPYYLNEQRKRLKGISDQLLVQAKYNKEIHHLSVLLGQLCERWHKAGKYGVQPIFGALELTHIKAILAEGEKDLQKLHLIAAASEMMLGEAYRAFGVDEPTRNYEVYAIRDDKVPPRAPAPGDMSASDFIETLPLGDGTVGAPDVALAGAI
jgi:hypothetical protein